MYQCMQVAGEHAIAANHNSRHILAIHTLSSAYASSDHTRKSVRRHDTCSSQTGCTHPAAARTCPGKPQCSCREPGLPALHSSRPGIGGRCKQADTSSVCARWNCKVGGQSVMNQVAGRGRWQAHSPRPAVSKHVMQDLNRRVGYTSSGITPPQSCKCMHDHCQRCQAEHSQWPASQAPTMNYAAHCQHLHAGEQGEGGV
jgi:hypothetical protein